MDGHPHAPSVRSPPKKRLESRLDIDSTRITSRLDIDSNYVSARISTRITSRLDHTQNMDYVTNRIDTPSRDVATRHHICAALPRGSSAAWTQHHLPWPPSTTRSSDDHLHAGTAPTSQHAKPPPRLSRRRPRRFRPYTTSSSLFLATPPPTSDKQSCASGGVPAPRVRSHGIPLRTAVQVTLQQHGPILQKSETRPEQADTFNTPPRSGPRQTRRTRPAQRQTCSIPGPGPVYSSCGRPRLGHTASPATRGQSRTV